MSGTGLDFLGSSYLLAKFEKMRDDVPKELDRALYREAQLIFRASQKIVPVDTGVLRSSGVVEKPVNHEVIIGYGGAAAPYAFYVHEDPEAKHKSGKSYKYLEIPLMAATQGMSERLAEACRKASEGESSGPSERPEGGDVTEGSRS